MRHGELIARLGEGVALRGEEDTADPARAAGYEARRASARNDYRHACVAAVEEILGRYLSLNEPAEVGYGPGGRRRAMAEAVVAWFVDGS